MRHTPMFDRHVRDASEVINLKGFARAMEYTGHLTEHRSIREGVGLCDVSHMGELEFKGADALALVQKLITNDASKLAVNQALYSVMCDEDGMVIDDLVCFRLAADRFLWIVNVTRTDDDYQWVMKHSHGLEVLVRNVSTDTALLSLQGPKSREVLQRITRADLSALRYYELTQTTIYTEHAEVPCIVSRTGYTGERGYEIAVPRDLASWVWDELLMVGRPLGIVQYGVAARESLRTEAGYLLNGNDMDRQTNPFEAGLGWVVKLSKDFVGRDALAQVKAKGVSRLLVGLEIHGNRTIRHGYPIYENGRKVGQVTSGPLSLGLTGRSLGLGYVGAEHAEIGTELEVEIRGTRCRARVVAMPFCARRVKEEPSVVTYSPYDLHFSDSHVWVRVDEGQTDVITLGLSDFGQRALGEILSVELPIVGERVTKGVAMGWLDSYRKPFDLISPVAGEVVEINAALAQHPARVNAYPYAQSGILKVRVTSEHETEALMCFEAYTALLRGLRRYDVWSKEPRMT